MRIGCFQPATQKPQHHVARRIRQILGRTNKNSTNKTQSKKQQVTFQSSFKLVFHILIADENANVTYPSIVSAMSF